MSDSPPRVTTDGRIGPVDATRRPALRRPGHLRPAAPARRGRPTSTSPSSASRSTPGSATGPVRGSARRTSASPRGCCAPTTRRWTSSPFARQQVADAGDLAVNPFSIEEAIGTIEAGADALLERGRPAAHHRR